MSLSTNIEQIYNEKFRYVVESNDSHLVDVTKAHKEIHNKLCYQKHPDDIWIFGYGSLIWKIDFPCIDYQRGYICGYLRRFYQHSIDHRGINDKPGRVVTLIAAKPQDRVYGVAYRISAQDKETVIKHLDFREKNGYERCSVPFHVFPEDTSKNNIDILIYIATPENISWAGDEQNSNLEVITEQIFTSAGQSGTNREYLFNLSLSMDYLFSGVHDDHLLELEDAVRKRIETDEVRILEKAIKEELSNASKYVKKITIVEKDGCETLKSKMFNQKVDHLLKFCSKIGWREYFLTKELYGIHCSSLWDQCCQKDFTNLKFEIPNEGLPKIIQ